MHSTIEIDVAAPPALVFALARDVERWERLLPHYARSRAVGRRTDGALVVDFVARRPLIEVLGLALPVTWRARTWDEPATCRLRFVHVAGATKGMDVTWRIEPLNGGSHISIDHDFRPRLPIVAAFVDRFFTRPIAGRTLATFKALAEALAEIPTDDSQSGSPDRTNPPI
jgi:ribosome-associated toxin RatA of RatAB toxin-antitoxin module